MVILYYKRHIGYLFLRGFVPEHARMDSPRTVGHSCLRFHGAIVKSQLWHLTADALQRGQEVVRAGQRLLAPLLFEQVWHHLRYLGGADWIPALTVGWKIPTNCEMDTCWRAQTLHILSYMMRGEALMWERRKYCAPTLFLRVEQVAQQVRRANWNLSVLSRSSLVWGCDGNCCSLVTENKAL